MDYSQEIMSTNNKDITKNPKSYLRDGQMTKDTDGYLIIRNLKSYLRGGHMTKDTNKYMVMKS